MGDCVLYSVCQETIGLITLNRPHAANSLSSEMIDHLQRVIEDIKTRHPFAVSFSPAPETHFAPALI